MPRKHLQSLLWGERRSTSLELVADRNLLLGWAGVEVMGAAVGGARRTAVIVGSPGDVTRKAEGNPGARNVIVTTREGKDARGWRNTDQGRSQSVPAPLAGGDPPEIVRLRLRLGSRGLWRAVGGPRPQP
jgi:hypothetical protein